MDPAQSLCRGRTGPGAPARNIASRMSSCTWRHAAPEYAHDTASAGVAATLDFISRHSASGSRVVYDYILRRVVEGDYAGLYGASSTVKGVARLGEPFVTGWTPVEAAAFAQRHGLSVLEDLDWQALTRRYLTGSDGKPDGRLAEWDRIIDAAVR